MAKNISGAQVVPLLFCCYILAKLELDVESDWLQHLQNLPCVTIKCAL